MKLMLRGFAAVPVLLMTSEALAVDRKTVYAKACVACHAGKGW